MQVAHLLLMRGADPDLVYETKFKPFPATYFALGAFTAPTNAHVSMKDIYFIFQYYLISNFKHFSFHHRPGSYTSKNVFFIPPKIQSICDTKICGGNW